jgi:hypothetical protein
VDWITLTHAEVENDALAPVCAHCGARAAARHNQDFEWHPDWVGWLFLAGVLPGVIAHAFCNKKIRVALPVCERHGPMTPWQVAIAAAGWLVLPALLAGATFAGCLLLRQGDSSGILSDAALITVTSVSAAFGLLVWLIWLIRARSGYRNFTVRSIDDNGLSLVGLAEPFVQAMREQRLAHASTNSHPSPHGIVKHPEL